MLQYPLRMLRLLLLAACASGAAADDATIGDLAMNAAANLPPFTSMITGFAYIMGIAFIISGIIKLKRHAENPQQVPMLAPMIFTVMGVLLIYFPTTVGVLRDTLFGAGEAITGMELYDQRETMDGTTIQSSV